MSTAIFNNMVLSGNLNISKADPEIRLTDTGSNYMRQYRSATTNLGYQYNRILQLGATNAAVSSRNVSDAGNVGGGTALFNGKSSITISCWIKIDAWTNPTVGVILSRGSTTATGFIGNTNADRTFVFYIGGVTAGPSSSNVVNPDGNWHHLVGTWTNGEPINIYVDNIKTSSNNKSGTITQDQVFKFGIDTFNATRKFNGDIDEIAMWDRRLTDAEVNELYNAGVGVFTDPSLTFASTGTSYAANLKVIHHASENTGAVLNDSSGNGNTGVGKYWATGWVQSAATAREIQLWSSGDSSDSLERGIQTFGDLAGRTVIEGLTTRFNVAGAEKMQLNSTDFSQTLPHLITGSSDVVQFKVIGNATQTATPFAMYQSDGTTIIASISNVGNLVLKGVQSTYNNIATVSNGCPSEYATVDLTAQTAAKTATTIYTPAASQMFRVSVLIQVTTAATTSSVLGGATGVVITYTDPTASVAQSNTVLLSDQAGAVVVPATGNTGNATTTQSSGSCIIYAKTGVAIQYAIGYTSVGATPMAWKCHLKVEAL